MPRFCFALLAALTLTSCATLRNSAKYDFSDGTYRRQIFGGSASRMYVHSTADSIGVFELEQTHAGEAVVQPPQRVYPLLADTPKIAGHHTFYQPSFDLDVLTIPFKFRPSVGDFPAQLNTAFNGAVYFGYRTDAYRLRYRRTPLGHYRRHTSHYGYSAGIFTGIGATPINPWVTQYATDREYDGFVFSAGIATIIALNSLSFGLGAGTDRLMDPMRQHWIYRGKIWAGVMFGLNLN